MDPNNQPHPMEEHHIQQHGYYYEQQDQYNMPYSPMGQPTYTVVQPGPGTHMQQVPVQVPVQQPMHQSYPGMMVQQHPYTYASSPPHVAAPVPASASPPPSPSSHVYDPLSPPISGSDTSADGLYHHSNSSGANSPSSSRGSSIGLVHRPRQQGQHRYHPTPSPTSSSGRRSINRGRSQDSDELDDDASMGMNYRGDNLASTRKEATRRQRIEAEQRRRDELRDGYARLKDVLPVSNAKSSKVSLLERATKHIQVLEEANRELQLRIEELEAESTRLRSLNEKISLADTASPVMFDVDARPLSPPPEIEGKSPKLVGDSSTSTMDVGESTEDTKLSLPTRTSPAPSSSDSGF